MDTENLRLPTEHPSEKSDDGASKKSRAMSACAATLRIVCKTLMGIIIIALLSLLAYHAFVRIVRFEDTCPNEILAPTDHKLFATKTTLNKSLEVLYRTDEPRRPANFSKLDLKALHKQLEINKCKPIQLHVIARHAARYPDSQSIRLINERVSAIKARIDLSASNPTDDCFKLLQYYKNWNPFLSEDQGDLITPLGFLEAEASAKYFKDLFPQFFDKNQLSGLDIGVTKSIRTAQTALGFLRHIDNHPPIKNCDLKTSPPTNSSVEFVSKLLASKDCFRELVHSYRMENLLEFHKECKKVSSRSPAQPLKVNVKNPAFMLKIVQSVSKRLKLKSPLSIEELHSLYKLCAFETNYYDKSVWCQSFSEDELEYLEFVEDVKHYYSTYGLESDSKKLSDSACVVVNDIHQRFLDSVVAQSNDELRASFFFTHSQSILRIFGYLQPNSHPESLFGESQVQKSLNDKAELPANRHFRSSMISPFSANVAFVMYNCKNKNGKNDPRIVTSINQFPIKLSGCTEYACPFSKFTSIKESDDRCNLEKICNQQLRFPGFNDGSDTDDDLAR